MNNAHARPWPTCAPVIQDPNATCDQCGASGAYRFSDVTLCVACYAERGSCCSEFAGNDQSPAYPDD